MQNKKVLLRISNLKQYFPLKKKGLYVKANDGVTLDIYEGETFGLVGESGCGKSTLGRTLLQLYRQTDGRTMYYGRTIDEIAPRYYQTTILKYSRLREGMIHTEKKRVAAAAALEDVLEREKTAGETNREAIEREKFAKMNESSKAEKDANDALLNLANIVGGFAIVRDPKPALKLFLEKYRLSRELRKATDRRKLIKRGADDMAYRIKHAESDGYFTAYVQKRETQHLKDLEKQDQLIASIREKGRAIDTAIDKIRKQYAGDAEFEKYEQYLDSGIDLARLTYNEMRLLRSDMQLIFQDPYSSLNPRMTVGQIVGESLIAHGLFRRNDARMQEKIIGVMESCGLAPYFLHRYPHQFSGGQRQRIGIARALAVGPKFIVCDEAVSALDVSIQSQIINLLQDLKESQNLTYMFITHDLSVVKYISDRIGVMYLGNLVEIAPSEEIFTNPVHPYTVALLNAIPTTETRKDLVILEGDIPSPVNPPSGCKFHTRCDYCTEICTQVKPEWEKIGENHYFACHHKLDVHRTIAERCDVVQR